MKNFTKNKYTQKILIVLTTVLLLNFGMPKPVHAVGGILLSPVSTLIVTIADAFQGMLEWAMLGNPNKIMKDVRYFGAKDEGLLEEAGDRVGNIAQGLTAGMLGGSDSKIKIDKGSNGKTNITVPESAVTGTLWGFDAVNVPVIYYTPEEIFANKVPMLDTNFVKPSVTGGDPDKNIAKQLKGVIGGWYNAIRLISAVGLLSVLVYIGIRILLTSVAADKAKYKKMLFDWLIGICLVFTLHIIMSFALTMSEVVTSMIAPNTQGSIHVDVKADDGTTAYKFDGNLMSYVRFMVQSVDHTTGVGFLALYIMLVIYTYRFTWTYLKRVANMALLTLIAPFVALTYPIDKVGDSSAQGFNMWIKEFSYNALLQPLHLLLYVVLLSSATELAVKNPIYAIVCLGFILTAEKLLRKMFGFDKASGGTLGSLAGAVGVTTFASNMLTKAAKGVLSSGGGDKKIRTKDGLERSGKNQNANKDFQSFDKSSNQGQAELAMGEGEANNMQDEDNEQERDNGSKRLSDEDAQALDDQRIEQLKKELEEAEYDDDYIPSNIKDKMNQLKDLEEAKKIRQANTGPNAAGSPDADMTADALKKMKEEAPKFETWRDIRARDKQADYEEAKQKRIVKAQEKAQRRIDRKNGDTWGRRAGISAYKTIKGIRTAAPTVAYKAARGALKTGARVAAAGTLAGTAGIITATNGNGEQALSAALGAGAVGFATGDNMFEATVGKVMKDASIKDSFGAGAHGSAIDARNAKADKEYLKSQAHKEEYEKYFKNSMTQKQFNDATRSYRESGITDRTQIRRALKLEQKYVKEGKDGGNIQAIRGKVQNIVQTYDNADRKAVYGSDKSATTAALKNIESQLTNVTDAKQKKAVANEILQGWRDFYNT